MLSVYLAVAAALLHVTGYTLYNVQSLTGRSKPNPVSWLIWAFLSALNAFSFSSMTDWVMALQFFAGTVANLVTFSILLFSGKIGWPKHNDLWSLAIGLVAALVWWLFKTATGANFIIVIGLAVSFIPTIKGVWRDPKIETPLAWWFWTIAPFLTGAVVNLRHGEWTGYVMPILLILGHGSVAVLARRKKVAR
ncbi:MAG: hypothetical protein ABIJ21_05145 [Nanoarchaeota archaeon]